MSKGEASASTYMNCATVYGWSWVEVSFIANQGLSTAETK